ncbi:MAG: 2-oxoglutarate and iron-dependent oxygenase domain-containing protein [Halofilum sp. (in: g-proteobacteria)]|nr:2-oxoglutarate and iron-dependent oxygenase domain-containing protein [Halofilum sp. (in: g-proteobacteria)]
MTEAGIPVVDIGPFRRGEAAGAREVVDTIRRACEEIGFFTITGHGVPDELVDRMYHTSRAFFDLAAERKARVGQTGDVQGGLMYFPMMAESLAASLGEQRPGDLKESLDYGPGFMGDEWPAEPAGLQDVWVEYYRAMSELSASLRRIFALAIGLPEDWFEDKFDRHHSSLRVINYPDPQGDLLPGQLRAGAHSDYGFLTILRSEDSTGGLQVRNRDGEWADVPTVEGAFIVNIGDAMMRWTNDRWVSTVHRVVNPPDHGRANSRRQSIPFFHNPNADAVIECFEAFRDADNPPKYHPVTYGEYADLKYRQTHGAT